MREKLLLNFMEQFLKILVYGTVQQGIYKTAQIWAFKCDLLPFYMKLWCTLLCHECGFNHQAAGRVKCNGNWSKEGSCVAACSVRLYPPGEFQHLQAKRQTAVTSLSPRWSECVPPFFESRLWWTVISQMMTGFLKVLLLNSLSLWAGLVGDRDSSCSGLLCITPQRPSAQSQLCTFCSRQIRTASSGSGNRDFQRAVMPGLAACEFPSKTPAETLLSIRVAAMSFL